MGRLLKSVNAVVQGSVPVHYLPTGAGDHG
jgi:hypothetical protein